ncbi:unnamed protein product [Didymodactylos carnosus]|uniref:Uncharacterized protein n=1 Tax=Didymodactylos carnosus TaxID=1234261 RepID=A0A8S2PKD9_9BILA|nr:unnamed protein product [Didymodactylos carnosus]CAF4058591.1 unnamed protein product [Didymodactylos carnosus]
MASPILLKAWFSNEATGLPFTSLFLNYRKSKSKMVRLTNAIQNLIQFRILPKGIGRDRHIVTARKETYMKAPPATMRSNANMLVYLQSIGIDLDEYVHFYLSSPLPTDMKLTEFAVNMILSNDDYIEICHLFNDVLRDQPEYNKTINQETSETEPENLQQNHHSLIDDASNLLTNTIDSDPLTIHGQSLVPVMSEAGSGESVFNQFNTYEQTNYEKGQTQSELQSIELRSNDDNNFLQTETTSYDMSKFLEKINSQQTIELISELIRNKNHLIKRVLEEQDNDSTAKQPRNNEREQITLPTFELDHNLTESVSPTPIWTHSTVSIGGNPANEQQYGELSSMQSITSLNLNNANEMVSTSNITITTMNSADVIPGSSFIDKLIDNVQNANDLCISNNGILIVNLYLYKLMRPTIQVNQRIVG